MKTNKIFKALVVPAITILLFSLAGCGQQIIPGQDTNPDHGGDKPVKTHKISLGFDNKNEYRSGKGLHAEDSQITTLENVVKLSDGFIVFTDGDINADVHDMSKPGSGYIRKVVNLSSVETDDNNWKIGDLNNPWTGEVPSEVTHVFIFANIAGKFAEGDITPQVNESISKYLTKALDAAPQSSAIKPDGTITEANSVVNATLFGEQKVQFEESGTTNISVVITPLVARFEITQIVGKNDDPSGAKLTSYNVNAMYMDSVVNNGRLSGTFGTTPVVKDKFPAADVIYIKSKDDVSKTNDYFTKYPYILADFCEDFGTDQGKTKTIGKMTDLTCKPATDGKVWAYNMFGSYEYYRRTPPTDNAEPTKGDRGIPMPKILLALNNVVVDNNPMDGYQFIKIQTYKMQNGGTVIDGAEVGNIYKIPEIDFRARNLNPQPTPSSNQVNVTVTQLKWTENDLGPVNPDE